MRRPHTPIIILTLLLALGTSPQTAWAQDGAYEPTRDELQRIYTTVISTAAGMVITALFLAALGDEDAEDAVYSTTTSLEFSETSLQLVELTSITSITLGGGSPRRWQILSVFLTRHANALAQDIALGSGPMLTDVASLLNIPSNSHQKIGRALRARREKVGKILQTHPVDARAFVTLLVDVANERRIRLTP